MPDSQQLYRVAEVLFLLSGCFVLLSVLLWIRFRIWMQIRTDNEEAMIMEKKKQKKSIHNFHKKNEMNAEPETAELVGGEKKEKSAAAEAVCSEEKSETETEELISFAEGCETETEELISLVEKGETTMKEMAGGNRKEDAGSKRHFRCRKEEKAETAEVSGNRGGAGIL